MSSDSPTGTYKGSLAKAGLIAASGVLLVGALALLSPSSTSSFWPFSSAQAADAGLPILHDPSIRLLAAALNSDPNPLNDSGDIPLSDGSALMPNSGPDGELPDINTAPATSANAGGDGNISVYTVQDGDSISGIAAHFGISVNTILWANDLTIRSTIKPGMSLVILPVSGAQHKVTAGETLSSIAQKYHASAAEIATFNGLDANATVVVGSTLVIPGGEVSSGSSSANSTNKPKTTTKATTSKTSSKSSSVKVRSDLGTASAGSGYFTNPVPGALLTQGIHGNNGVDLGAPSGTPIHAAADGTVIVSKGDGAWNGGYGSYVVVSHKNGAQTLYAHMSKDTATVGETVSQGEVIGYVGETGEATGNHLHFEVRNGKNWLGYSCSVMSKCY